MDITKIGHCCLLIKIDGVTILTDPGTFSSVQDTLTGIELVLITHEHADHLHVDSLEKVMANNPDAKIISNSSVGKILDAEGFAHLVVEGTAVSEFKGLVLEACDGRHEEIFEELGQVQNTGYMIGNKLFYPGDSFKEPGKPVDVLALPVAGPWCKIPDAIRYALRVKPRVAFPVHDAVLKNPAMGAFAPSKVLPAHGITFVPMLEGETKAF